MGDLPSLPFPAPSIRSSHRFANQLPGHISARPSTKNFLFVSHVSHFPHARSEVNAKGRRLSRFSPSSLPLHGANQTYLRFNFKRIHWHLGEHLSENWHPVNSSLRISSS